MIKRKVFLTILLTLILIVSGAAAVRAESGPLSESEITDILNEMKPVSDTYGQASAMMFFTGDTDSEIDVSCGQEKFWDLIHIYAFYMQHYYYDLNGSVPDLFLSWDDCKVIAGHLFKDFNGTLPDNAESYPFEVREDGVDRSFHSWKHLILIFWKPPAIRPGSLPQPTSSYGSRIIQILRPGKSVFGLYRMKTIILRINTPSLIESMRQQSAVFKRIKSPRPVMTRILQMKRLPLRLITRMRKVCPDIRMSRLHSLERTSVSRTKWR